MSSSNLNFRNPLKFLNTKILAVNQQQSDTNEYKFHSFQCHAVKTQRVAHKSLKKVCRKKYCKIYFIVAYLTSSPLC